MQAFNVLIKQTSDSLKLCLFIDGLDEYGGDHKKIADHFLELTRSSHVKVCVPSRPLLAFGDALVGFLTLRLQDLTFNDIKNYIADNLGTNRRFQQLTIDEPKLAPALIDENCHQSRWSLSLSQACGRVSFEQPWQSG